MNYALIMVNGKELVPTGEIKLPSLVNGKFHPYISNPTKCYEYLKPVIQKQDRLLIYFTLQAFMMKLLKNRNV